MYYIFQFEKRSISQYCNTAAASTTNDNDNKNNSNNNNNSNNIYNNPISGSE